MSDVIRRLRDALRPAGDRDLWIGEPPTREQIEMCIRDSFVACLEIGGGLLLLTGLGTRLIAIPFVVEMIVAILTTKISLYLGTSPLPMPPALPKVGIWAVLHEIRADYAQILTTLFLLINGPGKWSLDAVLQRTAGLAKQNQSSAAIRMSETAAD